jgi:S-DNA-T family DNA segregation ATPase FtsK/SpoIIIE
MFDPMLQRVRELGSPGVLLSGSKEEGPLLGDVKPSPQPPGRGSLVRRRTGATLVQIAWQEPSSTADEQALLSNNGEVTADA